MRMEPGYLLCAVGKPFDHYGVAVEDAHVVHLTDPTGTWNKENAVICRTTFAQFSAGRKVKVIRVQSPFTSEHIVERAEYCVGKVPRGGYNIVWRSCENFARFIVTGKPESTQARKFLQAIGLGALIYCWLKD